jgi:hypothetical protein
VVTTEWTRDHLTLINNNDDSVTIENNIKNEEMIKSLSDDGNYYIPFTGNGYIGISLNTKSGLVAKHVNSLSMSLKYNPLVSLYADEYSAKEMTIVEFVPGLTHRIQCYQNGDDCLSVRNTLYAHRTRPSVLIEEINFKNPSADSVTFDVTQTGAIDWKQTTNRIETIQNQPFTFTKGVIDVIIDNKVKHLCISVATSKLPSQIEIKSHDLNTRFNVITVVKYSTAFLNGKIDSLEPVLADLEQKTRNELLNMISISIDNLKQEHTTAWNQIWNTGFGISNSLAVDAINGDQLNATIYNVLSNSRAPSVELTNQHDTVNNTVNEIKMENCYQSFSTLDIQKLWKLPMNEIELAGLTSIWMLTLQKHGCWSLVQMGASGILQAIVLSIGGLRFSNHHLDLNLNPKKIHRDYQFRNINYANLSLITIEIEVGNDNHAQIYVTLNDLIDTSHNFYACDAGCIDPSVHLTK